MHSLLHTKYYNNDLRGYSKCNIIRIISPPFLLHLSVRSRIIIFPSTRQSTPPSSSTRQLLDAHSLGRTWNSLMPIELYMLDEANNYLFRFVHFLDTLEKCHQICLDMELFSGKGKELWFFF